MKLVVSNIAWHDSEEPEIAKSLQDMGIKYIEIAPTKIWKDPTAVSDKEIAKYKEFWEQHNIEIVAFQSMLYNRPDLKIFESKELRQEALDYLKKFIELAGKFGAKRMVFGSPKNRRREAMENEKAVDISTVFLEQLGVAAAKNNLVFCIEPNAPQYNCDFITTAREGVDLVRKVNNKGVGLHLDAACMSLAGEDIAASIRDSADYLEHYHISSPMLEQVEQREDVDHKAAANALKSIGYDKFISIEMRPDSEGKNLERVKKAVVFARQTYSS